MKERDIYVAVYNALDNALENDYDPRGKDVEDIISELLAYDADLENEARDAIRPHVESWLEENPK